VGAAAVGHDDGVARTILIVDDSGSFRATARAVLLARGYDVVGAAEDGASAETAVDELRPDAVLLDVNLPDTDGITVARRLAARNGHAPAVVLVSTFDAASLGEGIAASGARGFLPKAELTSPRLVELLGPPGPPPPSPPGAPT
jgi:DNA-binding NarL/FixJ family response regulator